MLKKLAVFLSIFLVSLTGCATTRKQNDFEAQGLRNQISLLETQIQSKDEEIEALRAQLARAREEKEALIKTATSKKKVIPEVKFYPSTKQIQVALRNAGYEPGALDGQMGRQTKEAIRAFQKANNLAVNGRANKKTRALLKGYLIRR